MERFEYELRAGEFCKRGFDLPQTKIPPLAIIAIRDAARKRVVLRNEINEKYSNKALAKQWQVHERTIEKILSYETGRHIP